jgi:uncharacterized protein (TIGR02001 family)
MANYLTGGKMKILSKSILTLMFAGCFLVQSRALVAGELSWSGDVTLVSTYVWRGVQQFEGTAAQGTITGSFGKVNAGLWYSSIGFGNGMVMETDPFVSLSLPLDKLNTSFGLTAYAYDFKDYNDAANVEFEIFATIGAGPFGLALFCVPNQGSMEAYVLSSTYWLQFSAAKSWKDLNLSAQVEYGNYSSRFVNASRTTPVGDLVFSANKAFSEKLSVGLNALLPLDSDMKTLYWLKITYLF